MILINLVILYIHLLCGIKQNKVEIIGAKSHNEKQINMTKNQKISSIIPLCNLLIELLEDKDVTSLNFFRHELKRSANSFIKELEKPANIIHSFKDEEVSDVELAEIQKQISENIKQFLTETLVIEED